MVAAQVNRETPRRADEGGPPLPVVLLLPGQGSQWHGMATGLYADLPAFAAAMDAVFDAMGAAGRAVRADWLAERPAKPVDHVTRSTPLLFAVDYALGLVLGELGVRPIAMLGHSAGELAAAVLAGVLDLATAATLVIERSARLAETPPGGMLAVAAGPDELRRLLDWPPDAFAGDDVGIAAINAPRQVILSGLRPQLLAVRDRLTAAGATVSDVPASAAFHSPALAGLAARDRALFHDVSFATPRIPMYSAYLGRRLDPDTARDPAYWAGHPAWPVLFWPTLDVVLGEVDGVYVECGPGQKLSTVARLHRAVRAGRSAVVPLLPGRPARPEADVDSVRRAVDRLQAMGHPIQPHRIGH